MYTGQMDAMILIIGGVVVGMISVVFGGGLFWSLPLWQFLFPEIAFGALVGNLKVGSLVRGSASTLTTWRQIRYRRSLLTSIPLLIGSAIGAQSISQLNQKWIILGVLIAVVLVETSKWIATKVNQSHFYLACLFLGTYFGFFGAGGGILLVALLRIRTPEDSAISQLKTDTRFIEMLMAIVAVIAHFLSGNIVNRFWIPWAFGSLIGGYLGGIALNKMGAMSAPVQKYILRTSYLLALFGSCISVY